ncbi:crossover junction endodeoxyribonuclease RuvA [Gilliamella sp. Nev6-6]|uniref:RusA family crossover junction endodeoxyribonuclease n=1 Tax=Gilliamella sp. Nev6-6 TaxID=3120252 RepID=UPI00080F58ED|nr:crossover junction endodeoxyribonuclease RuvA [Gilliamella apicola]
MIYNITPVPKPRMTQRDRWAKRKPVLQYFAFKDECKASGVTLPESHYHIIFVIPMPKSWSNKKRAEMDGKPHQQRPDKDNLEKGLLDAIFGEDCRVWDGRVTKIWGNVGQIIIKNIEE